MAVCLAPRIRSSYLTMFVMELLLNVIWLLLSVPAFALWRAAARGQKTLRSSSVLLVLACVLAILFPAVSASDDIQAMRPEIEEAATRDVVRHHSPTRFLASLQCLFGGRDALPALALSVPEFQASGMTMPVVSAHSAPATLETQIGRAPPSRSVL